MDNIYKSLAKLNWLISANKEQYRFLIMEYKKTNSLIKYQSSKLFVTAHNNFKIGFKLFKEFDINFQNLLQKNHLNKQAFIQYLSPYIDRSLLKINAGFTLLQEEKYNINYQNDLVFKTILSLYYGLINQSTQIKSTYEKVLHMIN